MDNDRLVYTIAELRESEELRGELIGREIHWVTPEIKKYSQGGFTYSGKITEVKSQHGVLYVWLKHGAFFLSGGTLDLKAV